MNHKAYIYIQVLVLNKIYKCSLIVFFQDEFGIRLLNDDKLMSALYLQADGFDGSENFAVASETVESGPDLMGGKTSTKINSILICGSGV